MCASVSVCVGELNPRRSIIYLFVYEHEIVIRLSLIWLFHLEIFDWIVCSPMRAQHMLPHSTHVKRKQSTRADRHACTHTLKFIYRCYRRRHFPKNHKHFSRTDVFLLHTLHPHPSLNHLCYAQNKSTLPNGFCFRLHGNWIRQSLLFKLPVLFWRIFSIILHRAVADCEPIYFMVISLIYQLSRRSRIRAGEHTPHRYAKDI